MAPLLDQIKATYLPQFEQLAQNLRHAYPQYKFNTYHNPVGTRTDYQGYDVSIECYMPDAPLDQSDTFALTVELCHLTTQPKIMASMYSPDLTLGTHHWFGGKWLAHDHWPAANPQTLQELADAMPRLIDAFTDTVARASRSQTPPP